MGVYIPNIDKPKRCELCPCSYYSEGALSDICQVTDKPITDGKPTNCPLIDIVTCGECKWSYTDERDGTLWCKVHMSHYRVDGDGFCYLGERRE
jgi:hypothetical protein